ncbi:MAG: hypothetical protein J7K00_05560 [Candidatus Diapherotrites archaeon]|nr:hypothetical protein [Candidatus Diapherotrites archaeon]
MISINSKKRGFVMIAILSVMVFAVFLQVIQVSKNEANYQASNQSTILMDKVHYAAVDAIEGSCYKTLAWKELQSLINKSTNDDSNTVDVLIKRYNPPGSGTYIHSWPGDGYDSVSNSTSDVSIPARCGNNECDYNCKINVVWKDGANVKFTCGELRRNSCEITNCTVAACTAAIGGCGGYSEEKTIVREYLENGTLDNTEDAYNPSFYCPDDCEAACLKTCWENDDNGDAAALGIIECSTIDSDYATQDAAYQSDKCDSPIAGTAAGTWKATPGGAEIILEVSAHAYKPPIQSLINEDYNNIMQRDEIICPPPHINADAS